MLIEKETMQKQLQSPGRCDCGKPGAVIVEMHGGRGNKIKMRLCGDCWRLERRMNLGTVLLHSFDIAQEVAQ